MKTIKAFMAVSALASVANAANATAYDISIYSDSYFAVADTQLVMNLSGTYDTAQSTHSAVLDSDVAGTATLSGDVEIVGFQTSIHYDMVQLVMDGSGLGATIQPDSSAANCTDNAGGAGCMGFSPALVFPLYNAIQFASYSVKQGTFDASSGTPFTPAAGTYTWTGIASIFLNGANTLNVLPLTVTLSEHVSSVPVPAAAWLFGSSLVGVAGAARRRRAK
jgi:hypothetical protein